ncbi:MAG: penicillin-binding protein 2 [Gammaproteobacteria bacterium]|jgi:cell division protein FtsI (penicillin-binding protein 3)|nr:penicillin-binding protein 2 [Gammaproteobacteria bacterium]MBT7369283.1 penicillin-binding protein 2 [Gammaproteobacteria bacterium]
MMVARIYIVAALVILLSAAMMVRLWYLQIVDKDFLQDQGDARTIRMERINAHRGMIQDRHGKPLAVSTPVLSLWANPSEVLDGQEDLARLTDYLGVTRAEFVDRLEEARAKNFVYLRRHLPPVEARGILDLEISGVYAEREYHRFYPAGEVASHIVGFTNVDDNGQEGLELSFDRWLAGTPGKKKVLKNLYGEIIRDVKPIAEAEPGRNLTLGIDLRLQYLAYRELKSAVSHYQAESGSVVVLDVETGQVLAMVNQPSYNPNNRKGLDLNAVRNRALTDAFEPGSTVKPFTVGVALQSGRYTPGSTIDTSPGFVRVGNFTIRDPRDRGVINLGEIIAHSSQVGISKLALDLNEYEVWGMFERLGFGRDIGTGFPGESAGYLPNYRRWKDIDRATFAYGYGLTVTPVQLASAYLTIAAGGVRRDISLIADAEAESHRIYPREVALQLREMLAAVVTDGTATKAAIDGYTVAGKTGTVRKIGETGYKDTEHLAFFAGLAPVDRPRLVGIVLINEPKTVKTGGGAIAAPVFSRVMRNALRIMNVAPRRGGAV